MFKYTEANHAHTLYVNTHTTEDSTQACKWASLHSETHVIRATIQLIPIKKVLIEALINKNKLIQLWQRENRAFVADGGEQYEGSVAAYCRSTSGHTGVSIVFSPLGPVKTQTSEQKTFHNYRRLLGKGSGPPPTSILPSKHQIPTSVREVDLSV